MKKVKLNEESYKRLKNNLINEITYGTVKNAYDRSMDLFNDVNSTFSEFYDAVSHAMIIDRWDGRKNRNPYLVKIKDLAEQIYDILKQKNTQQDNFYDTTDSIDSKKFYDSQDADDNELDDMELGYLRNNYK